MHRILLVEDDDSLIDGLHYALQKRGFAVDVARTVREAMEHLHPFPLSYHVLLLDVALPDGTGFDVCEAVRKSGSAVPLLFLTAADDEISIIRGLDGGGDDYLTKPFQLGELCARINALLRRANMAENSGSRLVCGDISIDLQESRAVLNGTTLTLTSAEYRLLCLLVRNAGTIVTRSAILDALWDDAGRFVDDNTLSVYIRRLREKVETTPSRPEHLITVRGFGYRWNEVQR